jgi:cyclomaltodextrinase / maltogenic alpha-amylase / neopullulanase
MHPFLMKGADWVKNSVIYHIFIDRFAGFHSTENWDQPVFLGGTIRGIISKLSYLIDLGVTTLWISPFYKTSAYHGYHITDFYQVDPHFGTMEDIRDLIQAAHNQNLHIIADFIPNHCSKEHTFFKEAQNDKNSLYKEWFYFTHWPDKYLCFLSVTEIPKLNLNNPSTRDHIVDAAKYWLSMGFDGFRLDHVIGPSHAFWRYFKQKIKDDYPNAVLIGEAWMMGVKQQELRTLQIRNKFFKWLSGTASDNLFKEYTEELDGVLDFKVRELIKKYVTDPKISKKILDKQLKNHYAHFPDNFLLPTFLDNHDMDRFLFECGNDKEKLKTAALIQFSLPQPAIIYYGTEIGMTQTNSQWTFPSNGDLQARQPMNWENQDQEILTFYKKLIQKKNKK